MEIRTAIGTIAVAAILAATLLFPGVAQAAPASIETTMVLDGHGIPVNPATGIRGVGTVSVEMHLSTSATDPFGEGAYLELPGLARVRRYGDVYGDYSSQAYMTPPKGDTWPGGAFGHMTPEQEQWYVTMRWTYAEWPGGSRAGTIDWDSLAWHRKHRRVLVTNTVTGRQAVAYIGDSGPARGLGTPPDSRIAGLSPDLMYFLSGQDGEGTRTAFGADDATPYRFEWVTDQGVPLGPVDRPVPPSVAAPAPPPPVPPLVPVASPAPEPWLSVPDSLIAYFASNTILEALLGVPVPDRGPGHLSGGNAVLITADGIAPVGMWSGETTPTLGAGTVLPLLECREGWYRVDVGGGAAGWLPAGSGVLVDRPAAP